MDINSLQSVSDSSTSWSANTLQLRFDADKDQYYVEAGGKRVCMVTADEENGVDLGGVDLRGASISRDTKIDVRTWKALALMGCVEGYEGDKERTSRKDQDDGR